MTNLPFSPDEILPRLRSVEELHHRFADDPDRSSYEVQAIDALELGCLVGRQVFINSALAFARRPDQPVHTRLMFPTGFLILGQIVHYATLTDEEIPLDSVTVNLRNAEVIDIAPEEVAVFKKLEFEIPILAINSLVYAEAA